MYNASILTPFSFTLKAIHKNGFHRKWSLLIILSLWILCTLNTFLLLPKFKVGYDKHGKGQTINSTDNDSDDVQMVIQRR